jgi:ATP-dependent Clp protease adaptor protein ClpS
MFMRRIFLFGADISRALSYITVKDIEFAMQIGEQTYRPDASRSQTGFAPCLAADKDDRPDNDDQSGTLTKTRQKTKKPNLYKVLLLNDDYTPMEFVVHILQRFFNKGADDATRIMLHVHQNGVGLCGVYTYEVAETKVTQVMDFARQHEHPLQCTMEKE